MLLQIFLLIKDNKPVTTSSELFNKERSLRSRTDANSRESVLETKNKASENMVHKHDFKRNKKK